MADAKLDVMAIEHRHLLFLGKRDRVALFGIFLLMAAMENGLLVGLLDDKFRLEHPGGVSELLGLLLPIDQKQGDTPEVIPLANNSLDMDVRELGIGHPVNLSGLEQDWFGNGGTLASLPHQFLVSAGEREGLAAIPVVITPARRDLERLHFAADTERHPEG